MIDGLIVPQSTAYSKISEEHHALWRNHPNNQIYGDITYNGQSKQELIGGKYYDTVSHSETPVFINQNLRGSATQESIEDPLINIKNPVNSKLFESSMKLDKLLSTVVR